MSQKILVLGKIGSGKTSFIVRLISGYFLDDLPQNEGVDIYKKDILIDGFLKKLECVINFPLS